MNMSTTAELQSQIGGMVKAFVGNITQIAQHAALESMRRAFAIGGGSGVRSTLPTSPGRPRGSHQRKRTSDELAQLGARFLDHVRAHPGLRIEQINRALGTTTKDLALPIRQMIAEGDLATKGQKRSTTYFIGKKKKPPLGGQ